MVVDLHTRDTTLPYHFFVHHKHTHEALNHSNNINGSTLKPQQLIPHRLGSLATPLPPSTQPQTKHNMPRFTLQHDHKLNFSGIASYDLESPWESTGSPESTLSSPLGSYQGSPGGSSQEPSSKSYDSCWENTYEIMGVLEKMKLEERGSSKSNYHPGYEIKSLETSNVVVCPLLQEQTRAIQLSGLKQEQIQFQRVNEYRGKNHGQFQKNDNNRRTRPPSQIPSHRQVGSEMRAILLDGSGSRPTSCGTGVFLPRGATTATAPSEPPRRRGKGCATVLIPARVVQALQLHFDQLSVASGPKVGAFPPLHDVLVSNRDGMYSIQKRQSRKKPTHIQNEMILPQEWTY